MVTKTGCDLRTSRSGMLTTSVSIEPKLVPIHSVGTSVNMSEIENVF